MYVKIEGRPNGNKAVNWVKQQFERLVSQKDTVTKIVMEDVSGRVKTSKLDLQFQDITDNFFILQENIDDFEKPLKACEASVRKDVMSKMVEKIPK